jgi:hypothetical protein
VEIRRIVVQGQPRKNVSKPPFQAIVWHPRITVQASLGTNMRPYPKKIKAERTGGGGWLK